MTAAEFLHPFVDGPLRDLCLAGLLYEETFGTRDALTIEELRAVMKSAHVPRVMKLNLADALAKSVPLVANGGQRKNRFAWTLTNAGRSYLRQLVPDLDIEAEHDVSTLTNAVAKIGDALVRDYVEECVKCLAAGAMRAAVVFLWAGSTRQIQEMIFAASDSSSIDSAVRKHDPRARSIKDVNDLCYVKESVLLLAAQDLGLFDKNQRAILEDALNLRNKCGHPGKYKPGQKKVSALIEDLVGIVFV
jgi:hypothetical protein